MMTESEKLFLPDKEKTYRCDFTGCKDTGFYIDKGVVKKCPNCNTGTRSLIMSDEEIERQSDILSIPEEYRDFIFDSSKIRNDKKIESHIKQDSGFSFYLDMVSELYNSINIGSKPRKSLMISAPQGLGKAHLVYSCMNSAIRNGKTVSPYLDTKELSKLVQSRAKEDTELMNSIVKSDLCFIKFATGMTTKEDTQVMKLIVDQRARKALPTIVTCRFPLIYLYSIEINLDRFIVTSNNEAVDYSRLRCISSPFPNTKEYKEKYMKWTGGNK